MLSAQQAKRQGLANNLAHLCGFVILARMQPYNPDIVAISQHAFDDEREVVRRYIGALSHTMAFESGIMKRAQLWVEQIRAKGPGHGMEAFLQAYGLDTREGVALMCLAEALLRIPDSDTANKLIRDTFEGKDWRQHLAGGEAWQVAASSWGLLLTGKVIDLDEPQGLGGVLRSMIARVGEPVVREALKKAMRVIGSQFVLGETIEEGLRNSAAWSKKGFRFSFDILGEGARSDAQALSYLDAYRHAIALVGAGAEPHNLFAAPSVSVKLSALHARYSLSQRERVMTELLPRLKEILLLAKQHNITVSIDAEEANRLDIELEVVAAVMADPDLAGWNGIGFVLQAYQKRAPYVIDYLAMLAVRHQRIIPLRLVKGAYWDSEIKHAQVMGLPGYPVFTRKEHTDLSYLYCAHKMLLQTQHFYPQFATHNARTIASIQLLADHYQVPQGGYEFQRLHGMGEALHEAVLSTHASRIYAPIGRHKDLLAYLIRRLLENGANSSFVHLLMDADVPLDELLANPVTRSEQGLSVPFAVALPQVLYQDRDNSQGMDMGYLYMRQHVEEWLASAALLLAAPRDHAPTEVAAMVARANAAFEEWAELGVEGRAGILEKIAANFDAHCAQLIRFLVQEAGKNVNDAIAEIREAIDFCRYYALHARPLMQEQMLEGPTGESNRLMLHPRGVFACISPWNFPLAIFTGQIVAALVTGNCVLAKPAEQTPRIAAYAAQLMHAAGVPEHVLQLAFGTGETVGAALTAHENIAGVVFTGSVEVAKIINRTLAEKDGPIVPLIAETGGMNCMVIDSSALLEAAVDDVVNSAFGSAGQRCSALRVLYVQEDIAEEFIALLKGAMQELKVGDPAQLTTDIGPVIDVQAQQMLQQHIARMKDQASLIAVTPAPEGGLFVAPHAFEIQGIEQLQREVFGPVLHIVRFKAAEMQQVADAINRTGYGLTFGMHSRIERNIQFMLQRVRVGNAYINRSMIGAVVGVQPFGGEGLSGTGPKAGGPHYLTRFLVERSVTANTAAIGGNLDLLSGE